MDFHLLYTGRTKRSAKEDALAVSSETASASKNPESNPSRFRVVGIGASAGGLESLEHFFKQLPPDPGMAFVVVQHLSPDFRSVMDELLARHCDLPIQHAEHNIEVEANRVYLLPPKKEMIIRERRLLLSDKERTHGLTLPIDQFFRSLAQDLGPEAIGVVLSGSGSDGSRGIREIKRMGGRVFVENPDSAKFDGMPLSALATGMVDRSATAGEIARLLIEDATQTLEVEPESEAFYNETPMESVLRLLRDQFGLDFSVYKTTTVSRRILRRVQLVGSEDLAEYAERLRLDPDELSLLYHDLLIGVTRFFRDPDAFDFLEQHVIPDILDRTPESEELRVWVAGCATGEEAYSLAMLIFEQLTARGRQLNVKILATDVHTASLAHASAGFYVEEQLEHVGDKRRDRFFRKTSNGYHISQDLRQLIVFAPHNIIKDAPFTKMHLITCRNLLIYFEQPAQKNVLSLFHFGLTTSGYLFLGPSETTGGLAHEFDTVNEHWKIYRKRRDVRLLEPLRLPVTRKAPGSPRSFLGEPRTTLADTQLLNIYDQLLDRHMPPSFLINEDRQLVDSFGGAERMFRMGRRRPSTNVLDLLEGELRTVVAGAIQRAMKQEGPVRYIGVPINIDETVKRCVLCAEAFTNPRTNSTNVLISIESESTAEERRAAVETHEGQITTSQASLERLSTLEAELSYTRETLQATIEELQTSNEEMQATNEELVASNEELQSTNEELHSVNEELYTVNAELQRKIAELRELNADMQHFLESTDVGILFLDRRLCIRKYTPKIASIFHIQDQDVGRSIRHFSHNLRRPGLLEDIDRALSSGTIIEDESRDSEGATYFLRVLPYRASAGADTPDGLLGRYELGDIEGVVISLTDISALERVRSRLRQMSAIVESSEDAIIGCMTDGAISTWNRGAERLYGYASEEVVGKHLSMLAPAGLSGQVTDILECVRRGERVEQSETMRVRKDGSAIDVSVTLSPILDSDGRIAGASAIGRDVTQLRNVQREVAEREARIRLLLESTAEGIIGLGPDGLCSFVNPSCVRLLGFKSPDQLIGRHIHSLIHPNSGNGHAHSDQDCPIYRVLLTGQGTHSDEEMLQRADGTQFISEYWSYPIRRGSQIVGVVVTFLDVTHRKQAEEEIRTGARRREEFLAMLSHELRNPLAAVLSAAKVMRMQNTKAAAIEKARQIVERQSRHMARLLDDLLDVSRITRGGIELRKEDLDMREVVRGAIEALSPVLEERQAQLTVDLPEIELPVRGDAARMQQVVVNLLSNAARYSPAGSLIQLSGNIEDDSVILKVEDHGRGISPSMLTDIFEMFVQDEQGLERSTGGLGIGLTLVRQIVELHGGKVQALSDGIGKGSVFVVTLPRQPHAVIHRQHEPQHSAGSRRILLVEDQDDAREMLRVLLESLGHVVVEEADGSSAVAAIEREHPDVALIDIGLPIMSGYEVARQIRQNSLLDDVVLVALTGYGRDSDVQAAKEAGFDAHLTKPADSHVIQELLAEKTRRKAS
jgi:two-component system, chemotaxis family, CheB/CheR fusion protein